MYISQSTCPGDTFLFKMMGFCVILTLFSDVYMTQIERVVQSSLLLEVQLGDSVTLECSFPSDNLQYIHWFKFIFGQIPDLVATAHRFSEKPVLSKNFNSSRFIVKSSASTLHLKISETELSDSAIYYCVIWSDYSIHFGAGTFLRINGSKKQKSNSMTVVQRPVSESVPPGDSVTLQCTVDSGICAGEHSVYWFRHGSGESLPGLIYTHGNRSDEAGSPTQSCVYSLPKKNLSRSDAGTYYCAVATCGEILFGNGTKVDIEENYLNPLVLAFGVLLTSCAIVIIFLICFRSHKCHTCSGCMSQDIPTESSTAVLSTNQSSEEEMLHYAALHITDKKPPKRERRKRDVKQESVYSDVRCKD
ncbi:hypothetical protein GN956_G14887 [Arapaima gigas]